MPSDRDALFALLDQIAAGLAREAALSEDERAAKAEAICRWFAPLYRQLQEAWRAAPCPATGWRLSTAPDGTATVTPAPPCQCADCFNRRYEAWLALRGRSSILPQAAPPEPAPAAH